MLINDFCGLVAKRKVYFPQETLSEILTMPNIQWATSRIWTWAEIEFWLSWLTLCGSGNHYTAASPFLSLMFYGETKNFINIFLPIIFIYEFNFYNYRNGYKQTLG